MLVTKRTHDTLKEQYKTLEEKHHDAQQRIAAQHDNFEALVTDLMATKDENASLSLFIQDCLQWIEDVPLNPRGTKTPGLMQRKKELREQALKYEILVKDAPGEAHEEQSA